MGDVLIAASHDVGVVPADVFDMFGSGVGSSWLFDAQCDSLTLGTPVTMSIPLGPLDGDAVQILGRLTRCVPGELIEVAHDQPWPGSLRVLIRPKPGGSTVTVSARLDERGLDWVMRRRGFVPTDSTDASVYRVGLVTSKSGPGAVYIVAAEYLADLAIEEINAEGGLAGKQVELLVGDDATDANTAALEAKRLIRAGCRVIVAGVNSASYAAIADAIGDTGIPLIHPLLNEGGGGADHYVRWGERPLDQVRAVAGDVMQQASGRRWFMIGNDYRWAYGAHRAGFRAIAEAGGHVAGNHFVPIGTADFSEILEKIGRSGSDCVLSTLIGADEVAFERQAFAAGLRSKCETVSLVMEESTRERVGDAASAGIWTALGYFQNLDNAENAELLRRYWQKFGKWAPPVSSLSESVYEAIVLYAAAVRRTGNSDVPEVVPALAALKARMPRGLVRSAGPHAMKQQLYVARAVTGGFKIVNA